MRFEALLLFGHCWFDLQFADLAGLLDISDAGQALLRRETSVDPASPPFLIFFVLVFFGFPQAFVLHEVLGAGPHIIGPLVLARVGISLHTDLVLGGRAVHMVPVIPKPGRWLSAP